MPTTKIVFDPAAPKSVNEGSAITFSVTFYDAGVATAPTTVRYRVDDVYSRKNVVDWTTVTTGATVSIAIAASLNTIIAENTTSIFWYRALPPYRNAERKVLTVEADNGTSTAFNGSAYYDVVNTIGI